LVQSEAHKYLGRRAKVTADAAPTTPECQSQLENLKGWARQPVGAASTSAIEKYAAFVTCPAVAAEAKRLLAARRGSPAVSLYGDSNVVRYCEQLKSYVAARAKERDIEGLRHVAGRDSCPEAKREAIAALAVLGVTIGPAKPGTVATAGDPALAVAPGSGQSFRDRLKGGGECQHCPDMVVIPSGSFTIGSPLAETDSLQNEGPQKRITFSQPFAVGRAEVTRGQFRAYVERSGAQPGTGCRSWDGREWRHDDRRSWMSAGFTQDDSHPVVCVSWDDIVGYVQWLSRETGYTYQLLSEAEWEYAARAGTGTMYYFDAGSDQLCRYGNTADAEAKKAFPDWMVAHCSDGFLHTAPTGRYQPNRWGLYDMIGNAAEWLDDCFNDSYRNVPLDGGSMTSGDCGARMHRGGSWRSDPGGARVAFRGYNISRERYDSIGFRVTRVMPR
jgi:formylglycine-generating enzyme required for sulfatase activity